MLNLARVNLLIWTLTVFSFSTEASNVCSGVSQRQIEEQASELMRQVYYSITSNSSEITLTYDKNNDSLTSFKREESQNAIENFSNISSSKDAQSVHLKNKFLANLKENYLRQMQFKNKAQKDKEAKIIRNITRLPELMQFLRFGNVYNQSKKLWERPIDRTESEKIIIKNLFFKQGWDKLSTTFSLKGKIDLINKDRNRRREHTSYSDTYNAPGKTHVIHMGYLHRVLFGYTSYIEDPRNITFVFDPEFATGMKGRTIIDRPENYQINIYKKIILAGESYYLHCNAKINCREDFSSGEQQTAIYLEIPANTYSDNLPSNQCSFKQQLDDPSTRIIAIDRTIKQRKVYSSTAYTDTARGTARPKTSAATAASAPHGSNVQGR